MENTCSNCQTLQNQYVELKSELSALKQCIEFKNEQCVELKNELLILQQKFDTLLTHVHRDTVEASSQNVYSDVITHPQNTVCSAIPTEFDESEATDLLYNIFVTTEQNCNVSNVTTEQNCNVSTEQNCNVSNDNIGQVDNTVPYSLSNGHPFSQFSLEQLDNDTIFIQQYSNRLTCFYGQYKYCYGKRTHSPHPFPHPNNYIHTILGHLKFVLPNYEYNSILITKYKSGEDYLGFHSDDEDEIAPGSSIVTISLGATRSVTFRKKHEQTTNNLQSLELMHGDMFIMSKESQHLYQHSVPSTECSGPRISITCRLLKPPHSPSQNTVLQTQSLVSTCANGADYSHPPDCNVVRDANTQSITVYISSSMFRGLDEQKLSSSTQQALVFFIQVQLLAKCSKNSRQMLNFYRSIRVKYPKYCYFVGPIMLMKYLM